MNQLKLQIAIGTFITFLMGAAFGLYIASVMVGQWLTEASR